MTWLSFIPSFTLITLSLALPSYLIPLCNKALFGHGFSRNIAGSDNYFINLHAVAQFPKNEGYHQYKDVFRRVSNSAEAAGNDQASSNWAPLASLEQLDDLQPPTESVGVMDAAGGATCDMLAPPQVTARLSRQSSSVGSSLGVRYRPLGKSGLRVPCISLGTWVTLNPQVSDEAAEEVVVAAYENGINMFDVSEYFSGDQAELRLGRILKKRGWKRSSFIVVTKIYWGNRGEEKGLSRKRIIESVKSSLRRLQLEYIDIIIVHKMDIKCPMEEVVRACSYCINQGWSMYWGSSRFTPVEIFEAYSNCRQFNCMLPIVEQTEYHMFCREKTELYMPETFNKIGVGCMTWSPLSIGFVSGCTDDGVPIFTGTSFKRKYSGWEGGDGKPTAQTFQTNSKKEEISPWNAERLAPEEGRRTQTRLLEISQLATRLGCSIGQLSIAWSLKNEAVGSVLVGATSVHQLMEQIHSLMIAPRLTAAVIDELEQVLSNKPVRYLPQSPISTP